MVYAWSAITLSFTIDASFAPNVTSSSAESISLTFSNTYYWDLNCSTPKNSQVCTGDLFSVFQVAEILTVVGCVATFLFSALSMAGTVVQLRQRDNRRTSLGSKILALSILFISFIAAAVFVVAFLYFLLGFPAAVSKHWNDENPDNQSPCNYECASFMGTNTTCPRLFDAGVSCDAVWGPNVGWWLALAAAASVSVSVMLGIVVVARAFSDDTADKEELASFLQR